MEIKTRVNTWDLMKHKSFCTAKETISKGKMQPLQWEKLIANEATDKELTSKIYKKLLEFIQTHVHWVDDAIQPSHPLSSSSPPAPIPPSIRVFSNESTLRMRWPKYWSFSFSIIPSEEHPGLISFRMDWLDLLQSKGLSRVFSNTTFQKHSVLSFLHSPTFTSIHDHRKNDSLD